MGLKTGALSFISVTVNVTVAVTAFVPSLASTRSEYDGVVSLSRVAAKRIWPDDWSSVNSVVDVTQE